MCIFSSGTDSQIEFFRMLDKKIEEVVKMMDLCLIISECSEAIIVRAAVLLT